MKNTVLIAVSWLVVSAAGAEETFPARIGTGAVTNAPAHQETNAPVKAPVAALIQSEVAGDTSYRLVSQGSPEGGVETAARRHSKIELIAPQSNTAIQPKQHSGVEYSGILVEILRNNPLQLFNPSAPAQDETGEANLMRNATTKRLEGLKLLQISF